MLSCPSFKAAVLGLSLLLGACDRESTPDTQPAASQGSAELQGTIDRTRKGSELPDFTFKDASGKELRLGSLKGKPLLINLWATWCAPCVAELPMLDTLARTRAADLKVLTISQDMGQPDKVGAFLQQRGVKQLEPWLDPEGELAAHYGVQILPTTVYYDAQGREVWRYVGGHDWTNAETAKMLAEAGQ